MDQSFKTPDELQVILGERLRALRLSRNFSQRELADKAGVSLRALHNLEAGAGSTIETFLRVLKALNAVDAIETLVPQPKVSPLTLLKMGDGPRRVSRKHKRGKPLIDPTSPRSTSSGLRRAGAN